MDCFYINLEAQTERRDALEAHFNAKKIDGWRLSRFEAFDAAQIDRLGVKGAASASEKACFLSHKALIGQNIGSGKPMLVIEDDVVFGDLSCRVIDRGIGIYAEDDWDIIFADICAPDVGSWPDIVRIQRRFRTAREVKLLDLAQIQFAGSACYLLNERSKIALHGLLDQVETIDHGYDIYLRHWTYQSKIRSFAFVPFATSLSSLSGRSSIQDIDETSPERIWDLFRRMVWMEGSPSQHVAEVNAISETYSDDESRAFGALFEAMLSEKVRSK